MIERVTFHTAAVRERDYEAVRRSKAVYGCTVDLAGLPTHMRENAKSGEPACEQPGDPVRKGQVEGCYPPFAESVQEDWSEHERRSKMTHAMIGISNCLRYGCQYPFDCWLRRSQRDQRYADDDEHSRSDQESCALARNFESQYRHCHGMREA
jgi:hypothetical protein